MLACCSYSQTRLSNSLEQRLCLAVAGICLEALRYDCNNDSSGDDDGNSNTNKTAALMNSLCESVLCSQMKR